MPDVQMKIPMVDDMVAAFYEAYEAFEQIEGQLKVIQGIIAGGALLGKGGQKYQDLIDGGIVPFTKLMKEKMEELAEDVADAIEAMQSGDTSSAGKFR